MANWLTVLLSALGGTIGAAAVLAALWNFLGKVWADRLRLQIEHENNERIEKLRAELQIQTDKTQKLLDAGVQKAVLVTRTQFETEFNAYKEIYAALCEVKHTIGATRPTMRIASENETEEERRTLISSALRELMAAHNKAILLKDNLAPFYLPDIFRAAEECLKASGHEIIDVQTSGRESFTLAWFHEGGRRQDAFNEAFYRLGNLVRERIASLGILPQ